MTWCRRISNGAPDVSIGTQVQVPGALDMAIVPELPAPLFPDSIEIWNKRRVPEVSTF